MFKKKIALYVRSIKTVYGIVCPEFIWASDDMHGTYRGKHIKYEYTLPAEQERIVKTAKDICNEYGFELEIVDVTRENILHKVIHDNIKGIDIYPALLSDSGRWVEGITSKRQVESFLSKEKETWF